MFITSTWLFKALKKVLTFMATAMKLDFTFARMKKLDKKKHSPKLKTAIASHHFRITV